MNAKVKRLLKHGANPDVAANDWGLKPLHNAVASDDVGTVKILLDAGADVNLETTKESPLYTAAKHGSSIDIVHLLLESGAHIDSDPDHYALHHWQTEKPH